MLRADAVCRVIGAPDPTSSGTDACPTPQVMWIRTGCLLLCFKGRGGQEAGQRAGRERGQAVLCWRTQTSQPQGVDQPRFAVSADFRSVNIPVMGDFPFPTMALHTELGRDMQEHFQTHRCGQPHDCCLQRNGARSLGSDKL